MNILRKSFRVERLEKIFAQMPLQTKNKFITLRIFDRINPALLGNKVTFEQDLKSLKMEVQEAKKEIANTLEGKDLTIFLNQPKKYGYELEVLRNDLKFCEQKVQENGQLVSQSNLGEENKQHLVLEIERYEVAASQIRKILTNHIYYYKNELKAKKIRERLKESKRAKIDKYEEKINLYTRRLHGAE